MLYIIIVICTLSLSGSRWSSVLHFINCVPTFLCTRLLDVCRKCIVCADVYHGYCTSTLLHLLQNLDNDSTTSPVHVLPETCNRYPGASLGAPSEFCTSPTTVERSSRVQYPRTLYSRALNKPRSARELKWMGLDGGGCLRSTGGGDR